MREKLSSVVAVLQGIVLTSSTVIGGVWSYNNRDSLMNRAVRSVNVSINARQVEIPGDKGNYILATVEFTNVGKDPENLRWPSSPQESFKVKKVPPDPQPRPITVEKIAGDQEQDVGLRLLPGQLQRRVFMARVDEPGLYYLEFSTPASGDEQRTASQKGDIDISKGEEIFWQDSTYLTVNVPESKKNL